MTRATRLRRRAALLVVSALAASCSVAVEIPDSLRATTAPTAEAVDVPRTEPAASSATPVPAPTPEPAVAMFGFAVSDEWPESFRDYVDFVQETRGEEFSTIADVRFADPVDLIAEFQTDLFSIDDLSPADQRIVLRLDDMYRALGLATTSFNILETNKEVFGDIAAFYDWHQGELVFPSPNGQSLDEIPLRDEPILVHELAHALQADRRIAWANRMEDPALSAAMLEGEAEWLFDRYVLAFTDAEWRAWNESLPLPPEPSDLPEILQVEFGASYVLGSRFFHARYADNGLQGIDDVFSSRPTSVSAQMLLDPWLFSGDPTHQETFDYALPEIRGEGDYVDIAYDFPMSAVNWHQILGAALPGEAALRAARGIDSYTLPTGWIGTDDQLCFAVEVSASIGHDEIVADALLAWANVDGVTRWVETTDRGFYVGGCDPGVGKVPTPRATPGDILSEVAYVLDTETWAVEQGLDPRQGFCAAWDLIALIETSTDDQLSDVYFSWFASLDIENLPTDC